MGTYPKIRSTKNTENYYLNNRPKIDIFSVNILCGVCKNTAVQVRSARFGSLGATKRHSIGA